MVTLWHYRYNCILTLWKPYLDIIVCLSIWASSLNCRDNFPLPFYAYPCWHKLCQQLPEDPFPCFFWGSQICNTSILWGWGWWNIHKHVFIHPDRISVRHIIACSLIQVHQYLHSIFLSFPFHTFIELVPSKAKVDKTHKKNLFSIIKLTTELLKQPQEKVFRRNTTVIQSSVHHIKSMTHRCQDPIVGNNKRVSIKPVCVGSESYLTKDKPIFRVCRA